jgi:choline kinase
LDKTIRKISKTLSEFQLGYIGMTYIGKNKLGLYQKALGQVIQDTKGKANVEGVLDYLSQQEPIYTLDLGGFGWHEVDNQEDLQKAQKALL